MVGLIERIAAGAGSNPALNQQVLLRLGWADGRCEQAKRVPDLMTSLDDVRALIPEGWHLAMAAEHLAGLEDGFAVILHGPNNGWSVGEAKDLIRAWLIAALGARGVE